MVDERLVRLAAGQRLEELKRLHGDVLPSNVLREGFMFGGDRSCTSTVSRTDSKLIVPRRADDRPEPEFLEERYAEFRHAS